MMTQKPTSEMLAEWKRIFDSCRSSMQPNRKTGIEVDRYFRSKYPCQVYDDPKFKEAVEFNIVENEHSRNKLKNGMKPDIRSYRIEDILVGIDLVSGEFFVESEDINKSIPIYDDLFVFRGLDEEDLKNCYLVAEYIRLTQ